jgi:hypothetical protein
MVEEVDAELQQGGGGRQGQGGRVVTVRAPKTSSGR